MTRGKHAHKKESRDRNALIARQQQLMAELADEQTRFAHAQGALAQLTGLEDTLRRTVAAQERTLSGYVEHLTARKNELEEWLREVRRANRAVSEAWDNAGGRAMDTFGGGREGIEKFMSNIGMGGFLTEDNGSTSLSVPQRVALQRARGERHKPVEFSGKAPSGGAVSGVARVMLNVAAGQFEGTPVAGAPVLDDDSMGALVARRLALKFSTPFTATPDAIRAWNPLPVLFWDDPLDDVPAAFGTALTGREPDDGHHGAHEALRRGQLADYVGHDSQVLRASARLRYPWDALPMFPRASDAITLRAQYANAAHGAWYRSAEGPQDAPLPDADPADETTWTTDPPSVRTLHWASAAVALRHAVPFWLPPSQTHGFLDGRPLTSEEQDDMRLPFGHVFASFADPLHVPGTAITSDPVVRAVLRAVRIEESLEQLMFSLLEFSDDFKELRPTAEMIVEHGARIEGVVLNADPEGKLRDEFVWCLSVGGAGAGRVAGRVAVPASLVATSETFRHAVVATAAVVSWASWHAPVEYAAKPGTAVEPAASSKRKSARPQDTVRVLNVTGTIDTTSTPTGKTVAAHLRRGHWRRQHHGPRGSLVKRVWVNPTLVNAGKFTDITPKVYRLTVA